MATTNTVLRQRVERGAALLDAEQPGWAPRIDLVKLAMSNSEWCVLGQLHPRDNFLSNYGAGVFALGIAGANTDVPYGFSTRNHGHDARLTPLWHEAIEARCGGSER